MRRSGPRRRREMRQKSGIPLTESTAAAMIRRGGA